MNASMARRKIGRIVVLITLIILVSSGVYAISNHLFSIQTIEVAGSNITVIVDQKKISKNLLFFPAGRFAIELVRDNPILASVSFQKKYPHTLVIVPTVRPAFARLQANDRLVVIDRQGYVLANGDQGLDSLPTLEFAVPAVRVGQKVTDPRVQYSLVLTDGLQRVSVVNTITQIDNAYLLAKSEKTDILIPQDKDVGLVVDTLQTLMTGFRIKGTLPRVVDLRFDKPIVTF